MLGERCVAVLRRAAGLAGLAALLLLEACGPKTYVAEKPLAEVHRILAQRDELPPVFGGNDPDHHMETADPKAVTWVLSIKGDEFMRFVAKLEPEGPTKTAVQLAVHSGPKFEARINEHPEVRDFYLSAMWEQVESKLENREYDITRTYGALGTAVAANMGQMVRNRDPADQAHHHGENDAASGREAASE